MKKVIKIYCIFILALIIMMGVFQHMEQNVYHRAAKESAKKYTITYEQKSPGVFESEYQIPDDAEGLYLAFRTHHFESQVLIGDDVVYGVKLDEDSWNRSTGYRMNFVQLKKSDSGKKVKIVLDTDYKNLKPSTTLYVGNEVGIYKKIVKENWFRFFLSVLVFLMGVMLFLYSIIFLKLKNADVSMVHFSVFSITLALWAMIESPITDFLPNWSIACMVMDHYMLMIMPMAFILFIKSIYSKSTQKIWSYCFDLFGFIMVLRTVLQFWIHTDFKQTLWITQLGILLFVLTGIVLTIWEVVHCRLNKRLKLNLACVVIILLATAIELGFFYFREERPAIGMLGFLIYVAVITYEMVKGSRKRMESANKADDYRKLAYVDELTGVYSRRAFHKHMTEYDAVIRESYGKRENTYVVFMFDLNDLKKCNDNFGHEYGDRYLVQVADALSDIFGAEGSCYRIGGDEFSALMPYHSMQRIQHMIESLNEQMEKFNQEGFVVHVSVASGYAVYDKDLDDSLEQTMSRADEMMYKNKYEMKNKEALAPHN